MTSTWTSRPLCVLALFVPATALLIGCSQDAGQDEPQGQSASEYLLTAEPPGARPVADVRKSAQNEDEVVVVGRIGGDANPWIEGMAAFLITDTKLVPCNERPGDTCTKPWDYCCDLDVLNESKVMVKFVDRDGQPLAIDAQKLFAGLKELDTVVVRGRAKRDEAGNVTILADGIFVRS